MPASSDPSLEALKPATTASDGLLEAPATSDAAELPAQSSTEMPLVPLTMATLLDQKPKDITSRDVQACISILGAEEAAKAAEAILDMADEVDLEVLEMVLELGTATAESGVKSAGSGPGESLDRLKTARDRLDDWKAMYPRLVAVNETLSAEKVQDAEAGDELDLDDPWAQDETSLSEGQDGGMELNDPWAIESSDTSPTSIIPQPAAARPLPSSPPCESSSSTIEPAIELSTFLTSPLKDSVLYLAQHGELGALKILRKRRGGEMFGYRLEMIAAVPAWVTPGELGEADLLPRCGAAGDEEKWTSEYDSRASSAATSNIANGEGRSDTERGAMTAERAREWYEEQIYALDELGMVDQQVVWVRQATLRGVTGIDAIGEDLSLLSALVYEASLPIAEQGIWSLSYWQEAEPEAIVQAYLRGATAENIVSRLRVMVLPYLHVLTLRAERSGRPDPMISERHLVDALLTMPLDLCLAVFEQSKATLPKSDRIIQDDLVVARLALALLYGTDATSASPANGNWSTRSAIFECLPVWDISGRDPEDDAELTSTTLDSIAAFVRPSPSQPRPPQPTDLMMFFAPLPFASLSRALDILDVHLESGEILARWDTPVEMRFLLQSARDAPEQTDLLIRMIKRASEQKYDVRRKREEDERWDRLWSDLLRLNGSGDQLLRGAFGMVNGSDIMRVYLGGILRSGNLDTARKMIVKLKINHDLTDETLEAIVLATSRELYDSAASGNLHTGEMKLAYDSLALAAPSNAARREKDFIEATSRLVTFTSSSTIKSHLVPREIRAHPNKLVLMSDVLSNSPDVYKHGSMLIELAGKLGLSGDVSRGRMYAMLAEIAVRERDWDMAVTYTQQGLDIAKSIDQKRNRHRQQGAEGKQGESSDEAAMRAAVCDAALRVGESSAEEWADVERKLALLGRTAEICSSRVLLRVLDRWAEIEGGRIKLDEAAKRRRIDGIALTSVKQGHREVQGQSGTAINGFIGSLRSAAQHAMQTEAQPGEDDRVLGSRRAARAARMAYGLGGMLGSQLPLPRSASPASAVAAASSTMAGAAGMFGLRGGSGARGSSGSLRSLRDGNAAPADDRPARSAGTSRTSGEYGRALDGLAGIGSREDGLGFEDVERVRRGARRALVSGVGWLLGAEEGEI